jgi:putative spermidine/putrescine transport system ATP-binding protein
MGYRNMIPVSVMAQEGEHTTVQTSDGVKLVGVKREELSGEAVAAVRPEDFAVVSEAGDNTLEAVVEIVEYHGREQAVEARLKGGSQLHVRTNSRLAPGDTITLKVPVERVLVFA